MDASHAETSRSLVLLRLALDALAARGHDLPDPDRLRGLLEALDPALAGDALGAPVWNPDSGLPDPSWIARLDALRVQVASERDLAAPPQAVIGAAGHDPSLGPRLIQRHAYLHLLQRSQVFPAPPEIVQLPEGAFWTWDAVLPDGRWGRIRVAGRAPRRGVPEWFTMELGDLEAEVAYEPVRRAVIGPAVRAADGRLVGVRCVAEATGEPAWARVVVDRNHAEDADLDGAVILPIAVPSPE